MYEFLCIELEARELTELNYPRTFLVDSLGFSKRQFVLSNMILYFMKSTKQTKLICAARAASGAWQTLSK